MAQVSLNANVREEQGKGAVNRLRQQGMIPAVLYSRREKPVSIKLNPVELFRAVSAEAGLNALINLNVAGGDGAGARMVLVKDLQIDPIKRVYLHADLMAVSVEDEVKVAVPVSLTGKAKGVAEGGVIQQIIRELWLYCRAGAIPRVIEVDISEMEIGDSMHISDVKLPEGVRPAIGLGETVAACVPPEEEIVATPAAAVPGAEGAAVAGAEGAAAAPGAEGATAPAEGAAAAPAAGKDAGAKGGDKKPEKK